MTGARSSDDVEQSRAVAARAGIQRFGGYLTAMVLPNIGAFIAWGLITALFQRDGWLPDPVLARLVNPIITYLLPALIGYTGGRLVHGQRGAVVGAVATLGMVVGTDVPMFLGAMTIGPFAGYLMRIFDRYVGSRVKPGFTMLVDNFSAGILGGLLAILGMLAIGPAVQVLTSWLENGIQFLVALRLLPLASIIIEPAKVLFLNNAVNHGILAPIGVSEAATHGQAVEFLMETNPGPGLGILLACLVCGPRAMRSSVPSAIVIQFFGGIHELYFPYVLARPRLVVAAIAGGSMGVLTFVLTGAGTVAPPSPGSILAVLAVTPKDSFPGVLAGVAIAAVTSFAVGAAMLNFGRSERAQRKAAATSDESALEVSVPRPDVEAGTRHDSGEHARKNTVIARGSRMSEVRVRVGSRMGLHARPAAALAEAVTRQSVRVRIGRPGGEPVDAASVLAVLSLGVRPGEEVLLSVDGGADDLLPTLAALLTRDLDAEVASEGTEP